MEGGPPRKSILRIILYTLHTHHHTRPSQESSSAAEPSRGKCASRDAQKVLTCDGGREIKTVLYKEGYRDMAANKLTPRQRADKAWLAAGLKKIREREAREAKTLRPGQVISPPEKVILPPKT